MSGQDPGLYARSFGDVYDHWYNDLDDPTALVASFGERLGGQGRILELGSGTGRLATPLHAAGYEVFALDISHAMLRAAPQGPQSICAQMTELPLASTSVDAVFVAYNTLFNLASANLQQQCFEESRRVLRSGGMFVVEAFIAPDAVHEDFGLSIRDHPDGRGGRLAILTGPDPGDPSVIVGSHVELDPQAANPTTTCRPWRLVYQSPVALDVCAARAGLRLAGRFDDWTNRAVDAQSDRHVSWYTTD